MNIMERLEDHYLGNIAALCRACGVTRQAGHKWFLKGRIPRKHWAHVMSVLPDVTIDDCKAEFLAKRRKRGAPASQPNHQPQGEAA